VSCAPPAYFVPARAGQHDNARRLNIVYNRAVNLFARHISIAVIVVIACQIVA
jgi:hypothetical protein